MQSVYFLNGNLKEDTFKVFNDNVNAFNAFLLQPITNEMQFNKSFTKQTRMVLKLVSAQIDQFVLEYLEFLKTNLDQPKINYQSMIVLNVSLKVSALRLKLQLTKPLTIDYIHSKTWEIEDFSKKLTKNLELLDHSVCLRTKKSS